jgi:catalase-peroxidase
VSTSNSEASAGRCPVAHSPVDNRTNAQWWPNQLNLKGLRHNHPASDPMGIGFSYSEAFNSLDLDELNADVMQVMTTSQPWWPADYGHYGPFFIRLTWHAAGTYRTADGRGGGGTGMQRFAPLNSWPDNGNLDKARRLLWPVKQKHGDKISWADLLIFAGNCAIESMGLKPFGFGGGRADVWEPDETYWGSEDTWLGDERYSGDRELAQPLGAVQMGLIYVNPQGPNANPDPLASARDIRETFARMAMNDEETVALIAGGHTFGKAHGAANPDEYVGCEPEGASLEEQGFGWTNRLGTGHGVHTITSGLEGAWTTNPIQWDNGYFDVLFGYEWELTKSPAGAWQWTPSNPEAQGTVPDAHDPAVRHAPMMLTSDLALRLDPIYGPISKRFHENPDQFADAFARAWFKLLHRDMGPRVRYLGSQVPAEELIWQDPVPAVSHPLVGAAEVAELKQALVASGLSIAQMVSTAWASAATFRGTDKRGGANGARIRLAPQLDWAANPADLGSVLAALEGVRSAFNSAHAGGVQVSLADLIVLAGGVGIEQAAGAAGLTLSVPFAPGRTDASAAQTDADSFAVLEPTFDGFRNYLRAGEKRPPEQLLVERAMMLTLSAPEMTALVGGLRVLGANSGGSSAGVLTDRVGVLSNDFFVNLLQMGTTWSQGPAEFVYEGRGADGAVRWTATAVDLVFGSNSELRALAEAFAERGGEQRFVDTFVAAWTKVMTLDRFDLA